MSLRSNLFLAFYNPQYLIWAHGHVLALEIPAFHERIKLMIRDGLGASVGVVIDKVRREVEIAAQLIGVIVDIRAI